MRKSIITFLLALLAGFGVNAAALSVTFEWDTPGTVKIQRGSSVGEWVELSPSQTSYVAETSGWIYIYGADGYMATGAETADGDKLETGMNANGYWTGVYLGSSRDGYTYKVSVEKIQRNDTFTIDIVNGLEYITAKFKSGYVLDLREGSSTYNFNPEIDKTLTLSLSDVASAFQVKLNGTDVPKNAFNPRYEDISISPEDNLVIQVFEDAEPEDCTVTFQYADGMEGCLYNIYNRTTGTFIEPDQLENNSLVVKENTELKVNFVADDYTITGLSLNGTDITADYANNSVSFTVTETATVLAIQGTAKVYANIDFTGYIINAEGIKFSMSYDGSSFEIPEGTAVTSDIKLDEGLTMPAAETKKYIIPVTEKKAQFFFSPKAGYYISNVYTLTPEGAIEQHSGSASINAKIDGTTFYMVAQKLPEAYTANMKVTGKDFNLRIASGSPICDSWGNPSAPSYSSAEGEREISFLPGYGTPITFGFVGDESQKPALYLDGAEQSATVNENSGAIEYFITPYYPTADSKLPEGVHSSIEVYNSFRERPQLSGASLVLEGGATADFFYSPVLHAANPAGQVVISGTQFTVRPTTEDVAVSYKGEYVALDENGEYVFTATGNARNNIVKVLPIADVPVCTLSPADGATVDNLSTITITFPLAKEVDYNEIGILLKGPETNFTSTDVHGSANTWEVTFHNPSTEGEYTVTIPAGAFTIDGEASPETSAKYTFQTGWEILPANGSTVENLDKIILSFPKATKVDFVGETYSFVLSNGRSFAAPGYNCEADETASVPTFILSLVEGVVPPVGTYTFTVEEGTFTVDGKPSAEIFVSYTIDREASLDYVQTPEKAIVYQDYGYDFALIFEEGTTVVTPVDQAKVKLTFGETVLTADDYQMGAEVNMLMFMVTKTDYIKPGHIKLEIEAGAFKLGSTPSPAISAEWDVVAPKTFDVEVTAKGAPDANGKVGDLSEIYIFFPEATSGEVFQNSGAQLRTKDYSFSQAGKLALDETATTGVKFIITFEPAPAEAGDYTLSVHEGTFTLDGTFASPSIEKTFTFEKGSGLLSILADENGCVTVVTIDGKVLLDKAPADRLRDLEKGLYIINGQKILIK